MTCGYAIEWLRNGRRCTHRLFRGHPEILTRGRYVRLPLDAAHFPYPHFFGSGIWREERLPDAEVILGELVNRYQWDTAVASVPPPPAVALGDPECFANGERWPLPIVHEPLIGGWSKRCWLPTSVPGTSRLELFDVFVRTTWATSAEILAEQYSDPDSAQTMLETYAGTPLSIDNVPNDTKLFPGSIVAVYDDCTVVVISGTTTVDQWVLQGLTGLGDISNFGSFSTVGFWYFASTAIHGRILAAGGDPTKPIFLIGHSLGGAVAQVLAGRYAAGGRPGPVSVLTMGCPRPGDARLLALVHDTPQTNLITLGDPIAWLPPTPAELLPVPVAVPAAVVLGWATYQRSQPLTALYSDGSTSPANDGLLGLIELVGAVSYAILGNPYTLPAQHLASTYRDWLSL